MLRSVAQLGAIGWLVLSCAEPQTPIAPPAIPPEARFAAVARRSVTETVSLPCEVRVAAAESEVQTATGTGVLHQLANTGDRVAAGDIIAWVVDRRRVDGSVRVQHRDAAAEAARLSELAQLGLIAPARVTMALERAEQLARELRPRTHRVAVRASRAGVLSVPATHGTSVVSGAPIAVIEDPPRLTVSAFVPEAHVAGVAVGDPVTVTLPALPQPFPATVDRLAPEIDPRRRSLEIGILADATIVDRLLPGMQGIATLALGDQRSALAIPRAAVALRDGQPIVVVRAGDSLAIRDVDVRSVDGGWYEVLTGLQAGELVAIDGIELLLEPVVPIDLDAAGPTTWLLTPPGRGHRLRQELPAGAVLGPPPSRRDLEVDVGRLLGNGVSLSDLRIGAPSTELPAGVRPRWPPRPFPAFVRTQQDQRAVDALQVPASAGSAATIAQAARRLDADADWFGHSPASHAMHPGVLIGAVLVSLLATGSVRAAAITGAGALAMRPWIGWVGDPPPATVVAAAGALGVAVAVAVDLALAEDRPSVARLIRQSLGAVAAPVALVAIALALVHGVHTVGGIAWSLGLVAIAVATLAVTMRVVPSLGSIVAAPLERAPVGMVALVVILAGALGAARVQPSTTIDLIVGGALGVPPAVLESTLSRLAGVAIDGGATTVLAAADADGTTHLVLSGPRADDAARATLAVAPIGIGLGHAAQRSWLGPPAQSTDQAVAAALGHGPVRTPIGLLRLSDFDRAGAVPVRANGDRRFARELFQSGAPVYRVPEQPGTVRATSHPPLLELTVAALLPAAVPGWRRVIRERRRGLSGRLAWIESRRWLVRTSFGSAAASLAAAAGLGTSLAVASVALALGLTLLGALLLVAQSTQKPSTRS